MQYELGYRKCSETHSQPRETMPTDEVMEINFGAVWVEGDPPRWHGTSLRGLNPKGPGSQKPRKRTHCRLTIGGSKLRFSEEKEGGGMKKSVWSNGSTLWWIEVEHVFSHFRHSTRGFHPEEKPFFIFCVTDSQLIHTVEIKNIAFTSTHTNPIHSKKAYHPLSSTVPSH